MAYENRIDTLGRNVAHLNNDVQAILDHSDLNWKTVPMPIGVIGKTEVRKSERFKMLCRSDNGAELGVASPKYNPVHNIQLAESVVKLADDAGLKVVKAGHLDGGERVTFVAEANMKFELPALTDVVQHGAGGRAADPAWQAGATGRTGAKVGDIVKLVMVLSTGHIPGIALTMRAWALRLICSNGATSRELARQFRMGHTAVYSKDKLAQLQAAMRQSADSFLKFQVTAQQLQATKVDPGFHTAVAVRLLEPDLWEQVVILTQDRMKAGSAAIRTPGMTDADLGRRVLDAIVSREDRDIRNAFRLDTLKRSTRQLIEAIDNQPGLEYSQGTAWQTLNGVTYWADHVRGRDDNAATSSAYFGTSAQDKLRGLELVREMAVNYARA